MTSDDRKPRLLIATRDRFPPLRVDLTELFGRWLSERFQIAWVMAADRPSSMATPGEPVSGTFRVSGPGALSWVRLQLCIAVEVVRGRFDLVQVRDAALSAALFLAAARIGRRPFVYWMSFPMVEGYRHRARHPTTPTEPGLRLARLVYGATAGWALYRLVLPHADHVFAQSERMKADLEAKGVPSHRITAAPMGVSVGAYHPQTIAPVEDVRLEGRRVLLYLGALDPDRDISMLVRALALVAKTFDVVLTLVGEASDADRGRLTSAAGIDSVSGRLLFTGRLPLAEALAYVRRADVCLAPFPVWPPIYLSATPTKLVEYLAMGRPVVATDHPDQKQVIEDSGAGVIAPATAKGFANAILALLHDPVTAETMGARGPAWVAAHRDYRTISNTVAEVYARLLERRP